jgi:hypothetical protein
MSIENQKDIISENRLISGLKTSPFLVDEFLNKKTIPLNSKEISIKEIPPEILDKINALGHNN